MISVVLVRRIGLVGVYIGTIISGLIANVTKPVIIYRVILDQPVRGYFQDSAKYMAALTALFAFFTWIKGLVMPVVGIGSFAAMFAIICVVFNGVFFLLFGRTQEFEYLAGIVKEGKRK